MIRSHGLLAIDLDGDVLKSGFELLMLVVSFLLAVDTELEVETVDSAVGVVLIVLPINVDMNVPLRAIMHYLERDPSSLHAADKGFDASVPSEGTILVVQHSGGSGVSLRAVMLDLEEREWGICGGGNEDLARELGHISVAVGVPISESDLGARIPTIGIVVVRVVIGEGPGSMVTMFIPVVLGSPIFVVALYAAVVAIEPDLSITAFVISELESLSQANEGYSCNNSQRYSHHIKNNYNKSVILSIYINNTETGRLRPTKKCILLI